MKKLIPVIGLALVAIAGTATTVAQGKTSSSKASAEVCVLLPDTEVVGAVGDAGSPGVRRRASRRPASRTSSTTRKATRRSRRRRPTSASRTAPRSSSSPRSTRARRSRSRRPPRPPARRSIDYDRQVTGGKRRVYVSFDGEAVGVLQGKGVVAGLKANGKYGKKPVVAELNGGQDRQQLDPLQERLRLGPQAALRERHVQEGPAISSCRPGTTRRPARSSSRCSSRPATRSTRVAAANDGLANAVVVALKAHEAQADPAERPGRDARRASRTSSPAGRP